MAAYDNEEGWIKHAGGIGIQIEMMGPERFQEYPAHGYFLMSRPALVSSSSVSMTHLGANIAAGPKCSLDQASGRFILASLEDCPLDFAPETKTPYQHLLDISCDGTAITEDRVAIDKSMVRTRASGR